MNDLISIVLPVYNGEKYLADSINSILTQTWQNWELVIVDDCSSDHTAEICTSYAHQDNRIRYYRNEVNLRLPRNLNRGFSLTKGDYLTWTSDDNIYLPRALETMLLVLKEKSTDFVCASYSIMDEEGHDYEYIIVDTTSPKRLIGENTVGACFLYSRRAYEATGEYNPDLTLVEDFDYWQRMASLFQLTTVSSVLYRYRVHRNALTQTMDKTVFNSVLEKTLLKNRSLFEPLDWEQKYYYYTGLSSCRKCLNVPNPDEHKRAFYSFLYFMIKRIPGKIRRLFR